MNRIFFLSLLFVFACKTTSSDSTVNSEGLASSALTQIAQDQQSGVFLKDGTSPQPLDLPSVVKSQLLSNYRSMRAATDLQAQASSNKISFLLKRVAYNVASFSEPSPGDRTATIMYDASGNRIGVAINYGNGSLLDGLGLLAGLKPSQINSKTNSSTMSDDDDPTDPTDPTDSPDCLSDPPEEDPCNCWARPGHCK